MRANGADTVYMSFGAIIKDFTREDLIELYRLVMQKYGTNRPEDAYDRVLWSDLRTIFDPPLNEDVIWSLPLQQKMINWRLAMLLDNASSAVTYTSISSDSNGLSWGIPLVNASELPEMDPHKEVAQQGQVYVLEPEHPEYNAPSDDDIGTDI
ncbi:hypothetical protein Tco_0936382 [Tanacetum coccineum]